MLEQKQADEQLLRWVQGLFTQGRLAKSRDAQGPVWVVKQSRASARAVGSAAPSPEGAAECAGCGACHLSGFLVLP